MADADGMRRVRFRVAGRVQGVGFRAHTEVKARRLGVVGFVENVSGGAVEGEAEGPADRVGSFITWLRSGPPWARVDRVIVDDLRPTGEDHTFVIRRN